MKTNPKVKDWAERIGQHLRLVREVQGLRLKDLSRLSGSTMATLSHIERGTRDVKLSTLVALTDALRVDLPTLFQHQQISPPTTASDHTTGYQLDDD